MPGPTPTGESPVQFNNEPDAGSTGLAVGVVLGKVLAMNMSDLKSLAPVVIGVLGPLGLKYGFDASVFVQSVLGLGAVAVGVWHHFAVIKPAVK